ncbi:hypothetical protein E2C01_007232 [Portunus trituberculatus]|uniref:Uncharacterized protein n=1 Tax=Portunus trituberculatus TaxID=210409 RepID=A0A5B7CZJ6_PORTR|nr:hypothetical protein [Portunus trituberculatus]
MWRILIIQVTEARIATQRQVASTWRDDPGLPCDIMAHISHHPRLVYTRNNEGTEAVLETTRCSQTDNIKKSDV